MTAPYTKGEYVRYASNGVCLIDDIRQEISPGSRDKKLFYILKPVSNHGGTIFVPADNPALLNRMRPLPTGDEINDILLSLKNQDTAWIDDRKARTAAFQAILKECDLRALLELVSSIYQRRQSLAARGKKLSASDESVLRRAEGLIENELSFVLKLEEKQVGAYIQEKLNLPD